MKESIKMKILVALYGMAGIGAMSWSLMVMLTTMPTAGLLIICFLGAIVYSAAIVLYPEIKKEKEESGD